MPFVSVKNGVEILSRIWDSFVERFVIVCSASYPSRARGESQLVDLGTNRQSTVVMLTSMKGLTMTEHRYFSEKLPINYIEVPSGFVDGMAKGNVSYQMKASMRILEEELYAQDRPHVLQLRIPDREEAETIWELYVDGLKTAYGNMDYAKQCFAQSATAFKDLCQSAIEDSAASPCTQQEYALLCKARRIAEVV